MRESWAPEDGIGIASVILLVWIDVGIGAKLIMFSANGEALGCGAFVVQVSVAVGRSSVWLSSTSSDDLREFED